MNEYLRMAMELKNTIAQINRVLPLSSDKEELLSMRAKLHKDYVQCVTKGKSLKGTKANIKRTLGISHAATDKYFRSAMFKLTKNNRNNEDLFLNYAHITTKED